MGGLSASRGGLRTCWVRPGEGVSWGGLGDSGPSRLWILSGHNRLDKDTAYHQAWDTSRPPDIYRNTNNLSASRPSESGAADLVDSHCLIVVQIHWALTLLKTTNLPIKGPGMTRMIRMASLVSSYYHPRGAPSLQRLLLYRGIS